jgi:hypothetical protein
MNYLRAYKALNKALFWSFFANFCAFLWPKNPFNQRNPRLINDIRSTKDYVLNFFCKTNPISEKVKCT